MFFRTLTGMLCLLLCGLTHARATDISGKALLSGKGGAGEAVVSLEGDTRAAPMAAAQVDQRDQMFLPHVSVVTRGTTVNFPNDDTVFHNVFAYFQAKKFDLGMYPRGTSKKVTFEKTGLVVILCNVHSDMSAYIMVVDTPYHAVTDKNGQFRIRSVPPGTYTLHAWHESGAQDTETITVKPQQAPLTLTLTRK